MHLFLEIFISVWNMISSVFPFIMLLGILVFIHELGHFVVARLCGVKVEVFSLGFGKKILKYKKNDTLYCLSLLPLGGYVKMYGHEYTQSISPNNREGAFLYKSVWQRIAIVLAGPLMNFFLAIFIFASLSIFVGDSHFYPVVGESNSSLSVSKLNLVYGDKILAINQNPVTNIKQTSDFIFQHPNTILNIKVKTQAGKIQTRKVLSTQGLASGPWGFLETGGVIEGLNFSTSMAIVGIINPQSPAALAGLKTFDQILSVNKIEIKSRKQFFKILSEANTVGTDKVIQKTWKLKVKRDKEIKEFILKKPLGVKTFYGVSQWGFERSDLFISGLKKGGVAEKAGLKKGDFIFKLNDQKVPTWNFLVQKIRKFKIEQGSLKIEIKRNGENKSFSLIPQVKTQMNRGIETKYYMLGIMAHSPHIFVGDKYIEKTSNIFKALVKGVTQTFHWCAVVSVYIKKFIKGEISRKTLGGAISIGRVAYDSYASGLSSFLTIMAILSVQLFLLNILPIPVFDGGHLLFYIIELVKGSSLSVKKIILAQQIGVMFLFMLLIFTTFNDLQNWLSVW